MATGIASLLPVLRSSTHGRIENFTFFLLETPTHRTYRLIELFYFLPETPYALYA